MGKRVIWFLSLVLAAALGAGIVTYFNKGSHQNIGMADANTIIQQKELQKILNGDTNGIAVPQGLNFLAAAAVARPAVVHVKTKYSEQSIGQIFQDLPEGFEEFHEGMPFGGPQEASGSGVIITADGYIATNNHVIKNAASIEVVLDDRRSYRAKKIGTDPTTDLALLKIEEKGLPFLTYGNSDKVQIGEWVLAVGNPFDLTSTVTAGIVSAKARNINIVGDRNRLGVESFIQTDAAVNPGNSGGALVNLKGQLVGINTAIASDQGSFVGYSFAIPSSIVKKVMEDLLKYGNVQRALLGVQVTDVTAQVAERENLPSVEGVFVQEVNPGSAAADAKIKAGDVILNIDEEPVNTSSELIEKIARRRPGERVKVTYRRAGKLVNVVVRLRNANNGTKLDPAQAARRTLDIPELGASAKELTREELKKLGLTIGVQIEITESNSKLAEAGINNGFILTKVDKQVIRKPIDLANKVRNVKGGILIEGFDPASKRRLFFAIEL